MDDFKLFSDIKEGFSFEKEKDDFELFSGAETKEDFVFESVKEDQRLGCFLVGFSFLITLIAASSTFLEGLLSSGNIAVSAGQVGGLFIFTGIVVLCFQIGKRFRNSKSRLIIYFWTMVVGLFSSLFQFVKLISGLGG